MKVKRVVFELDDLAKEFWFVAYQALKVNSMGRLVVLSEKFDKQTFTFICDQVSSTVDDVGIQQGVDSHDDLSTDIGFDSEATVSFEHGTELQQASLAKLYILYGAGIDSTAAYSYARWLGYRREDIALIHIGYGAPYERKEALAAQNVRKQFLSAGLWSGGPKEAPILMNVDIPKLPCEGNMPKGYIIPMRNALLTAVAGSMFGALKPATYWIVANYRKIDDDPGSASDKSRKFFGQLTEIMSRYYLTPMVVTSPFLHLSKAQSMQAPWTPPVEVLQETTTCYHPTHKRCHECFACFKLALALDKSGLAFADFSFERVIQGPKVVEFAKREHSKGRQLPKWILEHKQWIGKDDAQPRAVVEVAGDLNG